MAKEAEREFKTLCNRHNIWAHKWTDVRFCPNCRKPIFQSREDVEGESIIDYLCFVKSTPVWVECKGKPGHNLLPHNEISEKQRDFLSSWTDRSVWTFLFVTLGKGRAPTGRFAWLIPWRYYLEKEEINAYYRKSWTVEESMNEPGMRQVFWQYQLAWDGGGWEIPQSSSIVNIFPSILSLPPLKGTQ